MECQTPGPFNLRLKDVDLTPRIGASSVVSLDADPADPYRPHIRGIGPTRYHDRTGHSCSWPVEIRICGVTVRRIARSDGCGNAPAVWINLKGQRLQVASWPFKAERCAWIRPTMCAFTNAAPSHRVRGRYVFDDDTIPSPNAPIVGATCGA